MGAFNSSMGGCGGNGIPRTIMMQEDFTMCLEDESIINNNPVGDYESQNGFHRREATRSGTRTLLDGSKDCIA
jgi:hypothetical protein